MFDPTGLLLLLSFMILGLHGRPRDWRSSNPTFKAKSAGKTSPEPETESINTRIAVGAASEELAAAAGAAVITRRIMIWINAEETHGVHVKIGGAALTTHVKLRPGDGVEIYTTAAVNAIRESAATADVNVNVLALEVS